jgi:hypothetical protein
VRLKLKQLKTENPEEETMHQVEVAYRDIVPEWPSRVYRLYRFECKEVIRDRGEASRRPALLTGFDLPVISSRALKLPDLVQNNIFLPGTTPLVGTTNAAQSLLPQSSSLSSSTRCSSRRLANNQPLDLVTVEEKVDNMHKLLGKCLVLSRTPP